LDEAMKEINKIRGLRYDDLKLVLLFIRKPHVTSLGISWKKSRHI